MVSIGSMGLKFPEKISDSTQGPGLKIFSRASLQTPSKKFKGDSLYTGSDEDDDYNNVTMNKCFINYSALDDSLIFKLLFVVLMFQYKAIEP